MESTAERQEQEITVLKSIYAEDFTECPPPQAWKGATRLPEFIIKVPHPDFDLGPKVFLHLDIKFPKTYPTLTSPTFTIQQPIQGMNHDQVTRLSHAIHSECMKYRGSEMVFQIITFSQDWMAHNVNLSKEVPGSLANEMKNRANEEERLRKEREAAEAEAEHERAAQLAKQLDEEIRVDAQKQQSAKEIYFKSRQRADSDSTEVPTSGETPTESFGKEIEMDGVRFKSVKMFHPRKDGLGVTYLADPVCDDVNATLPLELFIVDFKSHYYTTTQGRKKLKQLENEMQRLTTIGHSNLLRILAVKLSLPQSSGSPHLCILLEQKPALSLQDVLEDCESLREDRAMDYLTQTLSALSALHAVDVVHRGINAACIGLANSSGLSRSKSVKLGRACYYQRLLDLHRSNSFGPGLTVDDKSHVPDSWLPKEIVDSPLTYTRQRDIHYTGIVLLQMLLGTDLMERFADPQTVFRSTSMSPMLQHIAMNMLLPGKKTPTCLSILADIVGTSTSGTVALRSAPMSIPVPKTPMTSMTFGNSPEMDYFRPQRLRHVSRWKEDWEELEMLGKGAFGSVVKARNKIDSRIYAVKKIRLRTMQSDSKIFREVNALSRLSHRFIVRYYTTWVETSESSSTAASDDDSDIESASEEGMTSVPKSKREYSHDGISVDLDDLDDYGSGSKNSFPSIHFTRSSSPVTEDGDDEDAEVVFDDELFRPGSVSDSGTAFTPPPPSRTLYIQMEFVERQTLKERVAEGLSEDEAWRLFQQIVDALVHMSSLGILHRDIKLNNIFIDGQGDCKVGDFGLATSSLAAVDPSDVSLHSVVLEADMTLEVGTRLYIAPEVQSRKRGPRDHTKADMYSLGIVFFEMNFMFSTTSERIAVIEDLRKPDIIFPLGWDSHRSNQREIITWLLRHNPNHRPTAMELSQSPLLPPRLEDEYFKGALKMMAKPDSPHRQALLSALFSQPPRLVRGFLYDLEAEQPEHAALNDIVDQRLAAIFRLHGAVDVEPPLLMPVMHPDDEKNQATFLDRHGDLVTLPKNILVPFARLAARDCTQRIKRYHVSNIYQPNSIAGHPKVAKAAVFDIITPDLESGPVAAGAEILSIADDCLNSFPNLSTNYEIHISHSQIVDLVLGRIPDALRPAVVEIMSHSKSTASQRRALMLKKGLLRSTADELEILLEPDEVIDELLSRLEKISPTLVQHISTAVDEVKMTLKHASFVGVTRTIFFRPLMLGNHHGHFKNGVRIEVVRRNKYGDVLAAGGRYDNLISRYSPPKQKADPVCAFGIQIAVEKITVVLASFQSSSVKALIKEQRSFGFWSPRRCDVYVVSYQAGHLQERLEVVAHLWQHNISADLMYESSLSEVEHENYVDLCTREGILFTVYPRPRTARRDQPAFKVKSVLKGTEYELSKQELVGWLQQQIAEQKRSDNSTPGAPVFAESAVSTLQGRDAANPSDVQLLLPVDTKKQRRQVKQLFLDRAFDTGVQIKSAIQNGMPTIAVDVPPAAFDAMVRNTTWISDDESWRTISSSFPTGHTAYAHQVRDAVAKRKAEGFKFALLFAVREERVQLISFN